MSLTLLCMLLSGFLCLTNGGNPLQTDVRTKVNLLKSLIYDNTKATVTLDSSAFKQLVHLSSDSSSSPKRVSFSASIGSNSLTLGNGQTLKFETILTNDGNAYDDRTGVFTCPAAGTYMFVVDALSYPGLWLFLKVNEKTVAKVHVSSNYKDKPLVQISRTVIVKLKSGDHVKVENIGNNGFIYYKLYSGFSGFLLY
uniref:C1q domain-containing protein n=1 Tax=Magallana gigas TaxID=29159 RepID=A0A8W8IH90_MAGGI